MSNISVFGLGYVGCVSAACFAREGHDVIGVDVSETKVNLVNRGLATIVEAGIGEYVADACAAGRLRATTDVREAVHASEMSLVCVGTPSRPNGSLDLGYVRRVAEQIGAALRQAGEQPHVVVIRSTVLPGTIEDVVRPALAAGFGGALPARIAVCSNPEFLREGTSIKDFYDPPFTLIGADDDAAARSVSALYAGIAAPVHVVPVRVAEMVKYVSNAFHALKVGFANEIGSLCQALAVDSHAVMQLICEDRKLNISPAYLKPGFAFGGSCLPKDVRAMTYRARELDVPASVLSAILPSNAQQIQRAVALITAYGRKPVAVLGLAFKSGTDDLRESPMVTLIEQLIGKGFDVRIFDRNVSNASVLGANRAFIEHEIPHIWSLVSPDPFAVVTGAELVVVAHAFPELSDVLARLTPAQTVIDLVRACDAHPATLARVKNFN